MVFTKEQTDAVERFWQEYRQGNSEYLFALWRDRKWKDGSIYGDDCKSACAGKQAIVLIPEIALTYQTVMRFYSRFGDRVSILNSRMSQGRQV